VRTTTLTLAALAACLTACAKSADTKTMGNGSAAPAAAAGGMAMDTDRAMAGGGLPAGFEALTDKADASIGDAKYTATGGKWEVQTGPAHILYAPQDTGSGIYAVTATIEQMVKPAHPEAYGIFFGGHDLTNRAKQAYGYFLVRGTGEFLIKTRNGNSTPTVVQWTANPNIPVQDASGKATYELTVHFAKDTAHFMVNGKVVDALPRKDLPSDGIAGLRINHNLDVLVTPVKIER